MVWIHLGMSCGSLKKYNFSIKSGKFLLVFGKAGKLMKSQKIKKAGKPLPLSETCG